MKDFLNYAVVTVGNARTLADKAGAGLAQMTKMAREGHPDRGVMNKKREYALLQLQEATALLQVATCAVERSSLYSTD